MVRGTNGNWKMYSQVHIQMFYSPGIPETVEHKIGRNRGCVSNTMRFRYLCDKSGYKSHSWFIKGIIEEDKEG